MILPDGSSQQNTYNKAGLLETVSSNGQAYVTNINYNEKGQRSDIFYGNGSKTHYHYDKNTFRLIRLLTTRNNGQDILQDIHYTYDPVGNIVEIVDNAQQNHYFSNSVIEPRAMYKYDALYRLTEATGRELASLQLPTHSDFANNIPVPNMGNNAMQNYTQQFTYDELGNILQMKSVGQWTRDYNYDILHNNYLTGHAPRAVDYTYDEHGNMLSMPHLQSMHYDHLNQLNKVVLDASGNTAYYLYDANGQRARKVVEKGYVREERIYVGGYEVFRKYENSTLDLERSTVHIMDDKNRVALIEKLKVYEGETVSGSEQIRYQYSNHLGSASLELNATGQIISYEEYHPFGTTSYRSGRSETEVSLKRYKYVGKERDEETGLYYYGFRYYAPWIARFINVDPLQHEYPHYTPFQYAGNKPVTYVDLDGLEEALIPVYHRTSVSNAANIFNEGGFDPNRSRYGGYSFFSTTNNKGAGAGKSVANSNNVVIEGVFSGRNIGSVSASTMKDFFNEGFNRANKEFGSNYKTIQDVPKNLRPKYQAFADGIRYNELLPEYMKKGGMDAYFIEGKNTLVVSENSVKNIKVSKLHATEAQLNEFVSLRSAQKGEVAAASKIWSKVNYAKWGGRAIILASVSMDVYEIFQSENKIETITTKTYGWTGAWIGASSFASAVAIGGQCGPQVLAPEEIITVPVAAFIGGVVGYFAGQAVSETIHHYMFSQGVQSK